MNRERGWVGFTLPAALVFVCYGPALHRYFTSEDFLLIRVLGGNPPWRDLESWMGPWLGITVVKFYRPVSTFLYGLEIAAFGTAPFGYNLVHTLVHAANALLVFGIARQLVGTMDTAESAHARLVAPAAAALFALHPLHPNAVLFGASFATVWGSAFVLASFLMYQRFRGAGGPWRLTVSLGLFVLALGSYETAATLPLLLLAHDGLFPRAERRLASLPFFAVLGAYFLLRRAIFGVFVGGYADTSARLLDPRLGLWLADLAESIQTLHAPAFDRASSPFAPLVAVVLACLAPLAFFALARRRGSTGCARPWLFGWAWIVIGMSPFAFRPVVPGNGRYWYLAAAGAAMAAAFLARAIATALPRRWNRVSWAALAAFGVYWAWLLAGNLAVYVAAGRTARMIQRELIREHAAVGAPPRTFVTRYPYFLYARAGAPVAQVFHYGLRDAVNPPFVGDHVPVYPLPPLRGAGLRPIFMADPHAVVFEWDGGFRRVPPDLAEAPPEIAVLAPRDGAVLERGELRVRLAPGRFDDVRLIVSAQGNGTVETPPIVADPGGSSAVALPAEFVTTMARLYPDGELFWWIEAREAGGRVIGISRMRTFRFRVPASPPS